MFKIVNYLFKALCGFVMYRQFQHLQTLHSTHTKYFCVAYDLCN